MALGDILTSCFKMLRAILSLYLDKMNAMSKDFYILQVIYFQCDNYIEEVTLMLKYCLKNTIYM